ncbi:MAG: arylesterase [Acidobacteria bacterium]|nr:arylesterase [Acidobacteriota bacterium]
MLLQPPPPSLARPAPAPQVRTLVFLGDSLTAGYGLGRSESFPSLVGERIRAAGLPWRTVNAGVTGDTSAGALARMDWILREKPDLIFICIGSNDGLRGLPIPELERNLRAILVRARQGGIRVALAGAMLPENYGPGYREAFRGLFPRLAREFRCPFLPFLLEGVAMQPGLNQADGIHPNAQGARIIAGQVWKLLEPELRKP